MNFKKADAELFIPDGKPIDDALKRTTCMTISAHQDDIEIHHIETPFPNHTT
jgi:hypothetical protein